MERIPPEVWGLVFGNLVSSQDFRNANNTCQLWREVLEPSRSSWMFGLVFEDVQEYLSVTEALQCREVCKHWLHGVSNYLENNPYFRPTFEEPGTLENLYKTGHRLDQIYNTCSIFDELVHGGDEQDRIQNVPSSLPLVGRWWNISDSKLDSLSQLQKWFLDFLGSSVWFLHFHIGVGPDAVDALKRLLEHLPLFPNLKRLHLRLDFWRTSGQSEETRQQLQNYMQTPPAMERIKKLPKSLETLEIEAWSDEPPKEIKEVILELLMSSGDLQSVTLFEMSDVACLESGNIVDLSVTLKTYAAVQQMLNIKSPVRRLKLGCDVDAVPPEALLRIAKHFSESLRNFHLVIAYVYRGLGEEYPKSFEKLCFSLEPFTNREILKDLNNVRRMTVEGSCLLSLNFLCGLSGTLEYLHMIEVDTEADVDDDEDNLEPFLKRMKFTEELDLLPALRQLARFEEKRLYTNLMFGRSLQS